MFIIVAFSFLLLGCIKMLVLQNIKISVFSTIVLSEMIRLVKYEHPTLYWV